MVQEVFLRFVGRSPTQNEIQLGLEALQAAGFPLFDETHDGKKYWTLEQKAFKRLDETGFTLAELSALVPEPSERTTGTIGVAGSASCGLSSETPVKSSKLIAAGGAPAISASMRANTDSSFALPATRDEVVGGTGTKGF